MTLIYSFISLGPSPDFKMTRGAIELNHRAVFSVLAEEIIKHSDAVYDRSLAQVMARLKEKISPYGWTAMTAIKWSLATDIKAQFKTERGIINATYRVIPELSQSQRDVLVVAINDLFKTSSPSIK